MIKNKGKCEMYFVGSCHDIYVGREQQFPRDQAGQEHPGATIPDSIKSAYFCCQPSVFQPSKMFGFDFET
jgi:hypothetical protein